MSLKRRVLLYITAGLGVLIILYSLIRYFTSFSVSEKFEKFFIDTIIFTALALFLYNRKLASDERKAKEAAEQMALQAERNEEPADDENLPHWERSKQDYSKTI